MVSVEDIVAIIGLVLTALSIGYVIGRDDTNKTQK